MQWAGRFLNAEDAFSHLEPDYVKEFNGKYPVNGAPLFDNGQIYTIRGDADGWDCFGWGGELPMGWIILRAFNGTDNDGLVPTHSAVIDGAQHIADFESHDHFDLTQDPAIAEKVAQYLK
jgi:hypothetical protein